MCDTIVALDSTTDEGFTLFGKNSDREPDEAQNIRIIPAEKYSAGAEVKCTYMTIPQVKKTARVFLCQPSGCLAPRREQMSMGLPLVMRLFLPEKNLPTPV
ncbi:MAG: hypothetical protein PHI72_01990 [Atribacterota bacterium]|jgi:dipeptidase|nr:hypothetical protein [Atribacterota bacterium]MDD4896466.1 hypothetical protein [Atribacterota bacterium]MDD5637774.1 hypothetical protein [Atribacterota bacterium]